MKTILKIITSLLVLPFIILGGVIAVVRTLYSLTFGLAWMKGDDWYGFLLGKSNDFFQYIRK